MIAKHMLRTGLILGVFAIIGTALVALTYDNTRERIATSERAYLLRSLHALITPSIHNNDIFTDTVTVTSSLMGTNKPTVVYRARMDGKPVAAVLTPIAPDGYNGTIKLLVAVLYDGTLAGVRVIAHRETPGLGDEIDEQRSDWILGFKGHSLQNPDKSGWAVKRDGGVFDQFTGATITPRAVVNAVHRSLQYYEQNKDLLFAPASNDE